MIVAVCVEDRGGLAFNRRRVSRDALQLADLLAFCRGRRLWAAPCSKALFPNGEASLDEDFLSKAAPGELCFVEDRALLPYLDRVEAAVLYRWNRTYPHDLTLDLRPEEAGFTLAEKTEFAGSSHEKITREVYLRKEDAHG